MVRLLRLNNLLSQSVHTYTIILVLLWPVVAVAAPLEEAMEAYRNKDYPTAFKKFTKIAKGPETSTVFLGKAASDNPGVSKEELVSYWQDNYSSDAKNIAYFHLGVMHGRGLGVTQNFTEAVRWFEKGAAAGDSSSESNLAIMYEHGYGVGRDTAIAFFLYSKASEQGNPHAMNNLGVLYEGGLGVAQNYVTAHKWYNLAAARADSDEIRHKASTNRDDLSLKMTPMQISEAQYLASQWKVKP